MQLIGHLNGPKFGATTDRDSLEWETFFGSLNLKAKFL